MRLPQGLRRNFPAWLERQLQRRRHRLRFPMLGGRTENRDPAGCMGMIIRETRAGRDPGLFCWGQVGTIEKVGTNWGQNLQIAVMGIMPFSLTWCLGRGSNPHGGKPQGILSPLCLPVPPPRPWSTLDASSTAFKRHSRENDRINGWSCNDYRTLTGVNTPGSPALSMDRAPGGRGGSPQG